MAQVFMASRLCPICQATMPIDLLLIGQGTLLESHVVCPRGHYEYHYVTGYFTEVIGDHEWNWDGDYGQPTKEGRHNALILARAEWRDIKTKNYLRKFDSALSASK